MKTLLSFILLIAGLTAWSQAITYYNLRVDKTNCYIKFPVKDAVVSLSYSPDSSEVYTIDDFYGEHNYSVIVVRYKEPVSDNLSDVIYSMQEGYLDFLMEPLGVTNSSGFDRIIGLRGRNDIYGIGAYWSFDDGSDAYIKSWANQYYLSVLMVSGAPAPEAGTVKEFLEGVTFP